VEGLVVAELVSVEAVALAVRVAGACSLFAGSHRTQNMATQIRQAT
jgi:hypothetical protein